MEINVVFSSDDKYVRHIFVSMNSLFESNKDKQMLNVYLVDNKISQQNKKILIELAKKYNRKLKFLPFSSIKDDLEGVSPWANSLSPYARLFLARYIDKDKVLYVDGDTAIVGDLEPLFEIDIDNYYLGAVQDTAGPVYREAVGITNNEIYFNSGVTIINLKKWREDKNGTEIY